MATIFEGAVLSFGQDPNGNGRIYPEEVVKRAMKEAAQRTKEHLTLALNGTPEELSRFPDITSEEEWDKILNDRCSGYAQALSMHTKEKVLKVTIELLESPPGRAVDAVLEESMKRVTLFPIGRYKLDKDGKTVTKFQILFIGVMLS